jgi:hypothetical protein
VFKSILDETLEAWADARQGVIDELENLPAESFIDLPPGTVPLLMLVQPPFSAYPEARSTTVS